MAELSRVVTYSQQFDQFRVSSVTVDHLRTTFHFQSWQQLYYRGINSYLEDNLTITSHTFFFQINSNIFPVGLVTYKVTNIWLDLYFQMRIPSYMKTPNPIKKWLVITLTELPFLYQLVSIVANRAHNL